MTKTAPENVFKRRLRWAGICLILGLLIEIGSLGWSHPLAFTLFLGPGIGLVVLGAAIFLWAVFQQSQVGWNRFDRETS